MVSASAEVYRNETVGYLVGYPIKTNFVVEYAAPFQSVSSSQDSIQVDENRTGCINRVINRFSEGLEIVGTFHSHAGSSSGKALALPSDADVNHILPDEVQLIVAVNPEGKKMKWREGRYTLFGTVDGLHVEIGGFVRTDRGRGWKRVHVNCAAITGVSP